MGRSKRKTGKREAKKAIGELQRNLEELGLYSPDPNHQIQRPERPSASAAYIEEPHYRKLLDFVVKSAMSHFGLMDYKPPDDLAIGDHFPLPEFGKVFKITVAQVDVWFPFWKEFFRINYSTVVRNREVYLTNLFKGLRFIHNRDRPFFENLLSGQAFVCCATLYFGYNGWQQALLHPFRVLATHFESQLRIPFSKVGGFKGLARFCENHELLKIYEMHFGPGESDIAQQDIVLEKDIKSRARWEVQDITEKYGSMLRVAFGDDDPDKMQQIVAWVHHQDLDFKQKRIVGNEWKYKDTLLPTALMAWVVEQQQGPSPSKTAKTEGGTRRSTPLIDESVREGLESFLNEFLECVFKLDKMAESMLD